MKVRCVNLKEINKLQYSIMIFVDEWARNEKTPVPRKEIVKNMEKDGVKSFTTINAINSLLKKGFIRRAVMISNKSYYVQLRNIK